MKINIENSSAVGMISDLLFIGDTLKNIKVYNVDLNTKYIINNTSDCFPELIENTEDSVAVDIHLLPSHY